MDNRDMNHFQMVVSVQKFMDASNVTWSAIPIINIIKAKVDANILGIRAGIKASGESTKGVTISKGDLKEYLSIKASVLSGALSAFASVSKNQPLLSNATLLKSDIKGMRDIKVPDRLELFTDLLSTHLRDLADYGVTEAQVTDLVTSVDDFREMVGLPRLKNSEIDLANKSAEDLLKIVLKILKDQLDNVMLQFKLSNPSFYEGYLKARVIID